MGNNKKDLVINIILWISRIFFGAVFIFSGFVKLIDPLGSAYKFDDYFQAFGIEWMSFMSLFMSIVMSTLELIIGLAIIVGLNMRYSAIGGLLFMAFFTPLTLYIAITDPVTDCGCFGDAIIFTNWQTFYKNIYLSIAAFIVFYYRNRVKYLFSEKKDNIAIAIVSFAMVLFSIYCLRNLPVIDFRPWKVGNYIPDQMKDIKEPVIERIYVYTNTETGDKLEVSEDEIMKGNVPDANKYEFSERIENVIDPGIPAPILNFAIFDEYDYEITEDYLLNPDYTFFVVVQDVKSANKKSFEQKVIPLYKKAKENNLKIAFLTSSLPSEIDDFMNEFDKDIMFYESEERELKTIVRSNPGLVLLKEGVVIDKWSHRNIPDFSKIEEKYF